MTKRAWDCRGIIRFCSLFPYSYCRPFAQRAFRSPFGNLRVVTLTWKPSGGHTNLETFRWSQRIWKPSVENALGSLQAAEAVLHCISLCHCEEGPQGPDVAIRSYLSAPYCHPSPIYRLRSVCPKVFPVADIRGLRRDFAFGTFFFLFSVLYSGIFRGPKGFPVALWKPSGGHTNLETFGWSQRTGKPSGGHNGFGNLRWKTHLDRYKLQKPSCTAYHCVIARRDLKVPTWQSVPPVMEQGIHIMQRRVLRTKGLSGRPLETFGWSQLTGKSSGVTTDWETFGWCLKTIPAALQSLRFRRTEGVLEQHGDRHDADAAGDGGDRRGHL